MNMLIRSKHRLSIDGLRVSSIEVATAAEKMSSYAQKTLDHALTVDEGLNAAADSAHRISTNLTQLSSSATDFTTSLQDIGISTQHSIDNIGSVRDATQELADASDRIASSTDQARSTAEDAVRGVDTALAQVSGLEEAAAEISKLTQVIHDISEQTKVLALNATIEAAREASAGRGFAVVAREVKDLAAETREATDFIRARVATIEETIGTTISAIKDVSSVIGNVSHLVADIADAASQQSSMTSSIAANADSASTHFAGIHDNIQEGSRAMDGFAARVGEAAQQSEAVSTTVQTMADASRGITQEATSSFASSLEIDERVGDLLWHFERAGLDVDADSVEEDPDMFRMSDRYSVYTPSMDDEHTRIFSYVNAVHRCFKQGGADHAALLRVFGDLAAYTAEHFRDEEALMRAHDYPAFPEHKAAHEELLATVGEFVAALQQGERVNPAAALNMLIHWLKHHIQHVDRNYGLYFRDRGITV